MRTIMEFIRVSQFPNKASGLSDYRCRTFTMSLGVVLVVMLSLIPGSSSAASPSFTRRPENQIVQEGSSVTFECKAEGDPTPAFQWEKEGKLIRSSKNSYEIEGKLNASVLRIYPVKAKAHNATFTCVAFNWLGEIKTNVTLTVLPKLDDVTNTVNGQIGDIFIDLDDTFQHTPATSDNADKTKLQIGQGHIVAAGPSKPHSDVIVDDEEFFVSGSGSGSGDFDDVVGAGEVKTDTMTVTTSRSQENSTSGSTLSPLNLVVQEGGLTERQKKSNNVIVETMVTSPSADQLSDYTFDDVDEDDDDENILYEDDDAIYNLPGSSPVISNDVISPAAWAQWSVWFTVGGTSQLRVRTCQVDGQDVSETACRGVRVQIKTCKDESRSVCGRVENIGTPDDEMEDERQYRFLKASNPKPIPQVLSSHHHTDPELCKYSLFDTHRQKYVYSQWNLTELLTRSKVKKWCDETSGQYIVMTTPLEHCKRFYKDMCKVSQRCRSNKPTRERGDFAEGCWRSHVYGDMLPIGLSNKQTIIYFICQRFAQQAAFGKTFGYKQTYFGTLYDTTMKAPVLSLVKISKLGDETWPVTDYLIEHGLVENENSMLWFFRKPKKGMLSLRDLELCQDDQSCKVGRRQIVPQDYREQDDNEYTPTHLIWPELMPSDPAPRIATFAMTNMAPLQTSLFKEWHAAVLQVRQYAIEQCGVPVVLHTDLRYHADQSSHRTNKSSMYLASGASPRQDSVETTGHDIRVPFLFWMAGCCVQHQSHLKNESDDGHSNQAVYGSVDESQLIRTVNITSFAVYIRNTPGSQVIAAPVLQLELLLQNIYRTTPSDPDVSLFPGHDSACRELKGDASSWFQK